MWFEHRDMVDGVNGAHGFWEAEHKRLRANFSDDLKRTKLFVREFGRGTRGSEERRFDEDLVADFEVRWGRPSCVSWTLVTLLGLCDVSAQHLVQFVEVCDVVTCSGGNEVAVGVNCKLRMIAFVGVEGGNTSAGAWSIVEGEFGEGE